MPPYISLQKFKSPCLMLCKWFIRVTYPLQKYHKPSLTINLYQNCRYLTVFNYHSSFISLQYSTLKIRATIFINIVVYSYLMNKKNPPIRHISSSCEVGHVLMPYLPWVQKKSHSSEYIISLHHLVSPKIGKIQQNQWSNSALFQN